MTKQSKLLALCDGIIKLEKSGILHTETVLLAMAVKLMHEALWDIYLNTDPKNSASLETRMKVIAIDSKTALEACEKLMEEKYE